ncbi:MAG TPA: DUF433 domain-containing protein [Candidatus Dormibacteraeota bacterium]
MREAAGWLGVPASTFQGWAHGYERAVAGRPATVGRPIVLSLPTRGREPSIPFLGLAEGLVLSAFRKAGVSLQRIRPALERLDKEVGLEHALASDRLYTDGADVLYDYGTSVDQNLVTELVVVRNQQRVFTPIVRDYLRRITYDSDHWAERIELPGYEHARVIVDLDRAFGRPFLDRTGVRTEDVVDRWLAGDSIAELAGDFGLTGLEVEDVVRAATRQFAA